MGSSHFPEVKNKEDPDKASENYRAFKKYLDAILKIQFHYPSVICLGM